MIKLRCFTDIRQLPLYIGIKACLWATIPLVPIDGSLFSKQLALLGIGQDWGWLMALCGGYLVFGALIARRETLTVALFLSASMWTALSILFLDASVHAPQLTSWITPVTLTMPLSAACLWMCLVREMLAHPVVIKERRRVPR